MMTDKVTVQLIGGLGNQLFQYAAGRALSEKLKIPLALDVSSFKNYPLRKYELSKFKIQENLSDPFFSPHRFRSAPKLSSLLTHLGLMPTWVKEKKDFSFDADFFEQKKSNLYVTGYYQSHRYFESVALQIRLETQLKASVGEKNEALLQEIAKPHSVAIHVRRGDYVSDTSTAQFHGTCGLDYYQRAVSYLVGRNPALTFFVFSDDPEWTQKNLVLPGKTHFVNHNPPSSGEFDLHLMRYCQHHIIANSSFSWWGAWLSERSGKTVIGPARWVAQLEVEVRDLFPSDWVRL